MHSTSALFFSADHWFPLCLSYFCLSLLIYPKVIFNLFSASRLLHLISASTLSVSIIFCSFVPGSSPDLRHLVLSLQVSQLLFFDTLERCGCFSPLYNCPYFLSYPSIDDLLSSLLSFSFHLISLCIVNSCISHLNSFLFCVSCHLSIWETLHCVLILHMLLQPS